MSDVDFELLKSMFADCRADAGKALAAVEKLAVEVVAMRNEMREGFAGLRAHDLAHHGDMQNMERRVADLELAVERINHAQGINTDDD